MREIDASEITRTVARLFVESNYSLTPDVLEAIRKAMQSEESPVAREVLEKIIENASLAAKGQVPLCQDCGAAVVFLELGQEVHVVGGDLNIAINEGVKRAYDEGYLRKSMVNKPFSSRINTRDNTPAIIYTVFQVIRSRLPSHQKGVAPKT